MDATSTVVELDSADVLARMRPIEGWFTEPEGTLLLAAAQRALRELPECAIAEIGSYHGRSTMVLASAVRALAPGSRLAAIDPHEGLIDMPHRPHQWVSSTYEALRHNLATVGLEDYVEIIRRRSTEVSWDRPIGLLFIDGLHDYDSVRADFAHFERWIAPGGLVAFHDYSCDFPDVVRFIQELNERPDYGWTDYAGDLILFRRHPRQDGTGREPHRPLPTHR